MVSLVSGHRINVIRERLADKAEFIRYDPWSELKIMLTFKIILKIYYFSSNDVAVSRKEESQKHVIFEQDPVE